jgi:hypothetical protein
MLSTNNILLKRLKYEYKKEKKNSLAKENLTNNRS